MRKPGAGGISGVGGGDHALLGTVEFASCGISGISGVGDNDAAAAASADFSADVDAAASERRGDAIAARNCERDRSGQASMQVLGNGALQEGIEVPMEA